MFIDTDEGAINLRHVICAQDLQVNGSPPRTRIWYRQGGEIRSTCTYGGCDQLEKMTAPVVPARPEYYVVGVYGSDGEYSIYRVPIVAWRIMPDYAEPVCYDVIDEDAVAILDPDGKVTLSGTQTFESISLYRLARIAEIEAKLKRAPTAATEEPRGD